MEILQFLISEKANVNAMDKDGETALDFAVMQSHNEIADLLRKHGAKTAEELKAEGK